MNFSGSELGHIHIFIPRSSDCALRASDKEDGRDYFEIHCNYKVTIRVKQRIRTREETMANDKCREKRERERDVRILCFEDRVKS